MNYYCLIPFILSNIVGFIILYVFIESRKSRLSCSFLFECFVLELWIVADFLVLSRIIPDNHILLMMKIRSLGWMFIGISTLNMILVFFNKKRNITFYIILSLAITTSILNLLTNFIFKGYFVKGKDLVPILNVYFPFAVLILIWIPLIYGIFILWKNIKLKNYLSLKLFIKVLIVLIFSSLAIGTFTNFFLPYFKNVLKLNFPAYVCVVILILLFFNFKKFNFLNINIRDISNNLFNSQDAILVLDNEKQILLCNNSAEEIFKTTNKELVNSNIETIIPDYDFNNEYYNHETQIPANSKDKVFSLFQSKINYGSFKLGKILFIKDVTEYKKVENENRMKSEFLAIISHELRTPLTGIIGFSEMLKRDCSISEKHKDYSVRINNLGNKLLQFLNDLLELSKIESGQIQVKLMSFDVYELINDIYFIFKNEIEKKGISFLVNTNGIYEIFSDQLRIKQILLNLIGNAVKFTDDGRIEIEVQRNNGKYVFLVKDTGIGIQKDSQKYIFDMFKQVEDVFQRKYYGAGVGLAVCKKMVKILNGELMLESELNKGSVFKFTIPVIKEKQMKLNFD